MEHYFGLDFPKQRVSKSERENPEWYANCCDYVIAAGMAARGNRNIDTRLNILHDRLPNEFYKKTLNPFNTSNEKWINFPATLRNYNIISGVIRRYVGEYSKNPHDFIVTANNPEIIMAKNAKLREQLRPIIEQQIAAKIQQSYNEFINQGNDPKQFNAQEAVDIDVFIKEFNENYIDEETVQGQQILEVIDDITKSALIYNIAYFDFVALGECYTHTAVLGDKLIKRVVDPSNAYPVPNDSIFCCDYDMFAECRQMSYQQIIDYFDENLDEKTKDYLLSYYAHQSDRSDKVWTAADRVDEYKKIFPDLCDRFKDIDRNYFETPDVRNTDKNRNLIDVWFVVWKGEVKQGIRRYINNGFIAEEVVDEDYKFNSETDIDLEWKWIPQVYESIRIGGRANPIYPIKARAIPYNRNGKLPYNGLMELMPRYGKFSIIDIMTPYQVLLNIIYYHREMVISQNKINILLIAKSLLGKVPDETIYRMVASGILMVDDEDDSGMLRTQQIRMLSASNNDYVVQLTQLIQAIEAEAKNQVDMTPQRYGEIANSAGKGVTDEAIMRGSMGSVIIEFMFDMMREEDYARDMDYSKFAWIDGLQTNYRDKENNIKYFSLDVDKHIYSDYLIKAKNSTKEKEKLEQLKQFAFSAAQNGNMDMAVAAITGDNVASVKKLVMEYQEVQRNHEVQMEQMKQQAEQMAQEFELQKIAAEGEQERATIQLEKYLDSEIETIRANANMLSFNQELGDSAKIAAQERIETASNNLERERITLERQKLSAELVTKKAEIAAKIYDSDMKYKIAKENKNKYDSKKTSSSKSK